MDLAPYVKDRFDMVFTHGSKVDKRIYDSFETATYLSRSFVMDGSIIRAPLSVDKICEIPMWYDGDESLSLIDSVRAFGFEASHLSKKEFDALVAKFLAAVKHMAPKHYNNCCEVIKSYGEYYDQKYVRAIKYKPVRTHSELDDFVFQMRIYKSIEVLNPVDEKIVSVTGPDVDRVPEIARVTQNETIGNYSDGGIMETVEDTPIFVHPPINVEKFDLGPIMEREYIVNQANWLSSQAQGAVIDYTNQPDDLFSNSVIANAIKYWTYFRCAGIEFTIRISASKFDYGALHANWNPCLGNAPDTSDTTLDRTGREGAFIFAETGETVVLRFPWLYTKRYLNIGHYDPASLGKLEIRVIAPLVNINGNAESVTVWTTAKFIKPEFYVPQASSAYTLIRNPKNNHVADSDEDIVVVQSKESVKKTDNFSELLEDTTQVALAIQSFPFRPALRLFRRITGLDKPIDLNLAHSPSLKVFTTDFYGKGISTMARAHVNPESKISTKPLPGATADTSLLKIAMTPMAVWYFTLFASTSPFLIEALGASGDNSNIANLDWMFQWHRGGTKYAFLFSCSASHSAKVVFYLAVPNSVATAAQTWQSCYHKEVHVTGHTIVEFTVPYMGENYLTPNQEHLSLYMTVVSFSQPVSTSTAPIYVIGLKAGAEDRKYAYPSSGSYTFTPQYNPRKEFLKPFPTFAEGMYAFENTGVVTEVVEDIRDIFHMMTPQNAQTTGIINPLPPWTFGSSNRVLGINLWMVFFKFYRGSIRVKGVTKNGVQQIMYACKSAGTPYPHGDMSSSANPSMGIELPYATGNAFGNVRGSTSDYIYSPNLCVNTNASANYYLFTGAGDDFTPFYIFNVPSGALYDDTNTTVGWRGFSAYQG